MVLNRLKNKYVKRIKLITYEFNYISKNYNNIFLKIINYILLIIYSLYQFIVEIVIITFKIEWKNWTKTKIPKN